MTREEIELTVGTIEYKPDWAFLVKNDDSRLYLQVMYLAPCNKTGAMETHTGRKWLLSPFMTKSEVVQTAFKAALTAEEHEVRENFRYRGKAIFGPHYNVDILVELCNSGVHEEKRA